MLTHENLSSNALTLIDCWRFGPADRLIHALPVFHTHGLFVAVNVALLSGATMIFMPRFDPETVIAALPGATAMMGVPTFYTRLLDHPGLDRTICANMRLFVSGSAPLLAETHAAWRKRTGFAILERYGMTETNMITSNPYDGERRPGSVGFALPGVNVRIADLESDAPVQDGQIGVIEVKGPNVFAGYWRMPEKTAQEFRDDGYFVTGDLAQVDDDGYIHIVGRAKDLVISGGFNVYPKEVEAEIDAVEGVLESAVFGVPHADFGEAVMAAVVGRAGATLSEAAILSALGRRLAKFKAPKQIVFLDFSATQRDGQGAEGSAAGRLSRRLSPPLRERGGRDALRSQIDLRYVRLGPVNSAVMSAFAGVPAAARANRALFSRVFLRHARELCRPCRCWTTDRRATVRRRGRSDRSSPAGARIPAYSGLSSLETEGRHESAAEARRTPVGRPQCKVGATQRLCRRGAIDPTFLQQLHCR